ncbi:MAG: hypothetical protein GKR99_04930 [Rhodobacteraceae bacterium]|nr:hypothetical protein [Paracoccaceae bacterium]
MKQLISATAAIFVSATALADPAVIEGATAMKSGDSWSISVTLSHGDTGWEDYADGWRVLGPDGAELGQRVLAHPHVNEQPFTRSQSGIVIPADLDHVMIEARTLTEGWGGTQFRLELR